MGRGVGERGEGGGEEEEGKEHEWTLDPTLDRSLPRYPKLSPRPRLHGHLHSSHLGDVAVNKLEIKSDIFAPLPIKFHSHPPSCYPKLYPRARPHAHLHPSNIGDVAVNKLEIKSDIFAPLPLKFHSHPPSCYPKLSPGPRQHTHLHTQATNKIKSGVSDLPRLDSTLDHIHLPLPETVSTSTTTWSSSSFPPKEYSDLYAQKMAFLIFHMKYKAAPLATR